MRGDSSNFYHQEVITERKKSEVKSSVSCLVFLKSHDSAWAVAARLSTCMNMMRQLGLQSPKLDLHWGTDMFVCTTNWPHLETAVFAWTVSLLQDLRSYLCLPNVCPVTGTDPPWSFCILRLPIMQVLSGDSGRFIGSFLFTSWGEAGLRGYNVSPKGTIPAALKHPPWKIAHKMKTRSVNN